MASFWQEESLYENGDPYEKEPLTAFSVDFNIVRLIKKGKVDYFVATKYESLLQEEGNFQGSQTFSVERSKINGDSVAQIDKTQTFREGSAGQLMNSRFADPDSYELSNATPRSRFFDIQLNVKGPQAKSVAIRLIQFDDVMDIQVASIKKSGLSLEDAVKLQDYNSDNNIREYIFDANLNVYPHHLVCKTTERFSERTPRPNFIK